MLAVVRLVGIPTRPTRPDRGGGASPASGRGAREPLLYGSAASRFNHTACRIDHQRVRLSSPADRKLHGRVVGAILDSETPPAKAAALGIQLVNSVDPPSSAEVELSGEITSESIKNMSYSELLAAAERLGISLDRPDQGAIEGATTELLLLLTAL
jgi:hypothetical protein